MIRSFMVCAVLSLGVLLLAAGPALAFRSWPRVFNGVMGQQCEHVQITSRAARAAGFDEEAARDIENAAIGPDVREFFLIEDYAAARHFDRPPAQTTSAAFAPSAAYVREQRDLAVRLAVQGRMAASRRALGRSLHALQDLFSHSNYVSLTPDEQRACLSAVWSAGRAAPANLKLTAYDPDADDPENPDSDREGYTHGAGAKDAAGKSPEAARVRTLTSAERMQLIRRKQELMGKYVRASSEYQKKEIRAEMQRITDQLEPRTQAGRPEENRSSRPTNFASAVRAAADASATLLRQVKVALPSARWRELSRGGDDE